MKLRIAPPAESDIRDIFEWYAEKDADLPAAFRDSLDQTLRRVLEQPRGYPTVHGGVRRALLERFPYAAFYLVEREEVVVLGVFHGRRNPKIWKLRADA